MSHSPLYHTIKTAIAESLKTIPNKPVASGQVASSPATGSHGEATACVGLAEAYLDLIRKRGPRLQLQKNSTKIIRAAWRRSAAQNKD